jgi:ketosteroid isomerase-like protein
MKSGAMSQTLTAAELVEAPTEREEIVARLLEAFNGRDIDAMLALVHPEIVFLPVSAAVMSDGQPYLGHAGLRRYLQDVATHWLSLSVHPVQIRAAGEAVVALGRVKGQGPAGVVDEASTTWVVKFRDNLVIRIQVFSDERPLREAFGLDG